MTQSGIFQNQKHQMAFQKSEHLIYFYLLTSPYVLLQNYHGVVLCVGVLHKATFNYV